MVCVAARRDLTFSSLVAWPLEFSCGFSPTGICSQDCPRSHESAPARKGYRSGGGCGCKSAYYWGDRVRRMRWQPLGLQMWGQVLGEVCSCIHKRASLDWNEVLWPVAMGMWKSALMGVSLMRNEAEASAWWQRLQMWPLDITAMALCICGVQVCTTSIQGYGFPRSCPLRLSLHS